jgi:hypothetical protein
VIDFLGRVIRLSQYSRAIFNAVMIIAKKRVVAARVADVGLELLGAAIAWDAVTGSALRDVSTATDSAHKTGKQAIN